MEKRPFFWADMARLGKYSMGGYGRIGVHRVKFDRAHTAAKTFDLIFLNRQVR